MGLAQGMSPPIGLMASISPVATSMALIWLPDTCAT